MAATGALMVGWGQAVTQLLGFGNTAYRINAAYIEFKNVSNPNVPVAQPSFQATDGLAYYQNLPSGTDYIRALLQVNPMIGVVAGYANYFSAGQGNQLQYFAATSGSAGVNGSTFGSSVNSVVYGMALVAAPVLGDPTQDILIYRGYFDPSEQVVMSANRQICVGLNLGFPPLVLTQ